MNRIRLIILAAVVAMAASCSKKLSTSPLSFTVTTDATTYHVGDTVHFNFTGNPDIISFYSGEAGHDYAFRDRVTIDGVPQLQFTSYEQYGTQQNTLQLLVSTDYNGVLDSADIYQATWTDITDRATFSTGQNNTPSGIIDLSDMLAQNKPINIAFKYSGVTGSTQRSWTINNFNLSLLKPDNSVLSIADITSAGWTQVNIKNPAAPWTFNATQLHLTGGNAAAPDNEAWVISSVLYLNKVAPDTGVPIKDITETVNSYDYVFTQPGNYKVVFLAVNATGSEQNAVTKEIDLTIE